MSKKDVIVGLDIGTTKVCCIVGEIVEGGATPKIDIIGIGTAPSTGLRKGAVVNIDSTVKSINKAIEEAELMADCEITAVTVGIAGAHIKSFNSSGVVAVKNGEIDENDVKRVIDAAKAIAIPTDREIIHVIPQEYIIDDQDGIRDPIGMSGVRLEAKVHIVTGGISSAQNIIKCANRAALRVSEICLQPIASSTSVLSPDEKELGVVIVDIGGGTSDIAIFKEGAVVHTAILPIGGQHLTNDIAVGVRTPQNEAEKLKVNYGCAMTSLVQDDETVEVPGVGGRNSRVIARKVLAEIIEPRIEEILSLIHQELVRSGFRHLISAGVVLTGGTAQLTGICELAEQIFELPVKLGVPTGVGGLKDVVTSPSTSTAVGLMKYGARNRVKAKFPMNEKGIYDKVRGSMKSWMKDLF